MKELSRPAVPSAAGGNLGEGAPGDMTPTIGRPVESARLGSTRNPHYQDRIFERVSSAYGRRRNAQKEAVQAERRMVESVCIGPAFEPQPQRLRATIPTKCCIPEVTIVDAAVRDRAIKTKANFYLRVQRRLHDPAWLRAQNSRITNLLRHIHQATEPVKAVSECEPVLCAW